VLAQAVGRGEALRLAGGESRETELLAIAYEGLEMVGGVSDEGEVRK
jgi:hypothetical protein